nr:hypothetical protein [Chroococcidiopsis cubana]
MKKFFRRSNCYDLLPQFKSSHQSCYVACDRGNPCRFPLTPESPTDTNLRVLACLAERNVTWRYSLLSRDRLASNLYFDAPDIESVRESYRKGGGHI